MHCLDAEAILRERCPDFYHSLVEEYPEGFPLTDESFDEGDLSGKKVYWERQLQAYCREKSPSLYSVYRCAELNAFAFFVGLILPPEHRNVAAALGNYAELKADLSGDNQKMMARCYPQAADIFRAKREVEKLLATQPTAEEFLQQVENTLFAIDRAVEHDSDRYEAYVAHDPGLNFNCSAVIRELIAHKLIDESQLEGRSSGCVWTLQASQSTEKADTLVL